MSPANRPASFRDARAAGRLLTAGAEPTPRADTGRLSRRDLLAMGAAGALLAACGGEQLRPEVVQRPYWEPAIRAATQSIDVLRLFEVNSRALAQDSLSPRQYAFAIASMGEQVARVSESLVPLNAPPDAAGIHPYLLGATDGLVEAVRAARRFEADGKRAHLLDAVSAIRASRENLSRFVASVGGGKAAEGLRNMLEELGDFQIISTETKRYVVLVGQFDSPAEARAKLRGFKDDAEVSIDYRGWVEVAREAELADAVSAMRKWLDLQFETRIEEVDDLVFRLEMVRAPTAASWKELLWLQKLNFDPTGMAAAAGGSTFALVGRHGEVRAVSGKGDALWSASVGVPLASVAVSPAGDVVAAYGFDVALLDGEGRPIWQRPFRPDNQLIVEAELAADGFLAVRSTNVSEVGHVFAYTKDGPVWGPTQDYIGAASLDVHPGTGLTAVASVKGGENQVILIRRDGNLAQRFGVDAPILKVMLSADGSRTIVHSAGKLSVFENESGGFLTEIPFAGEVAARGSADDTLYVGTSKGLAAYGLDGAQIWFNDQVAPRSLLTSRSFVCGISSDTSVSVVRIDGTYVGEATTLSSIKAVALAEATDVLAIASSERNVLAWQLPV